MKIKDIKKEIDGAAPDLSEKISRAVDWDLIAASNERSSAQKERGKTCEKETKPFFALSRRKPAVFALVTCAALLGIVLPLVLLFGERKPVPTPVRAAYDLMIDVNPSVLLTVDEDGKIIAQKGLNEDGVVFLIKKIYVGLDVDRATDELLAELKKLGLANPGSTLRISAFDHATGKIRDEVQYGVEKKIENLLGGEITTIFLSDYEIDKIKDYYEKNSVSEREKELIESFAQKVLELARRKIADVNELLAIVEKYSGADEIVFTAEEIARIKEVAKKYNVELPFDPEGNVDADDLEEFADDLSDDVEDLVEALEESDEWLDGNDYAELWEELSELCKEEIFNHDD